jgi:AcrR family transcriptional regulator
MQTPQSRWAFPEASVPDYPCGTAAVDWHDGRMTERNRPAGHRGAETRQALLQAAVAVVDREGLHAVTTRRIAEEAGLPHGTVHYWFADKADLLRGVMETMLNEVRPGIVGEAAGQALGDSLTRIHELFVEMPIGRQLALLEFTLAAPRTEALHPLAEQLYTVYTEASREVLQPWAEHADSVLPGGADALATLQVAVIDGLTLAGLAGMDAQGLAAARDLFIHLVDQTLDPGVPAQN